ncbi:hypothetical protein V5N11_001145 [Cardamine amara subsp. amara]|uniref:DUF4283 domain-containing protein n=1 Tax=Cardamine amara subsp. amara TaxID=228776 RepID=A0ABD1C5G0_CARAN
MPEEVEVVAEAQTTSSTKIQAKKSWVSRASLKQFDYELIESESKAIVAVLDEIIEDAMPLWEDFLIGRFSYAAPHVAKIHFIVNKIWNLADNSIMIDVLCINETTVKFRICNASARLRALRRGMWNICEIPMVMSKWTPIVEEAQPAIKSMPMWVKIKNVPNTMFTWKGLSFLASPIGIPLRLHQETDLVTSFEEANIFVDVNLSKKLPRSYFFKVKGEEVNVTFEYPWLPQRCGICEKLGHGEDVCLANRNKGISTQLNLPRRSDGVAVVPVGEPILVVSSMVEGGIREEEKETELSGKLDIGKFAFSVEAAKVPDEILINWEQEEGKIVATSGEQNIQEVPAE